MRQPGSLHAAASQRTRVCARLGDVLERLEEHVRAVRVEVHDEALAVGVVRLGLAEHLHRRDRARGVRLGQRHLERELERVADEALHGEVARARHHTAHDQQRRLRLRARAGRALLLLAEARGLPVHVRAERVERVVEDGREDLAGGGDEARAGGGGRALGHAERPLRAEEQAAVDERAEERDARGQLHVLAHRAQLLHEQRELGAVRVALVRPARVGARRRLGLAQRRGAQRRARERARVAERRDDVRQERGVLLHERDDVDLVEDDARVQDVERAVVDRAREHDVLEELQPVRAVHFARDVPVPDRHRLVELRGLLEKFPVVGLVRRELRVVCGET